MSWFQDDVVLVDERPRETVAEGVQLERRSLLRFSAATVAAGLVAACSAPGRRGASAAASDRAVTGEAVPAAAGRGAGAIGASLDITEFLDEMYPRAGRFASSGAQGEEAYLMAIAELMTRLEMPTREETRAAMRAFRERVDKDSFGIAVVKFKLGPGKGFSHHDHRDYNGVILGVEGEAHVRNFDILGDNPVPPKGETFQIRQTRDDLILPGRFSTLATNRDNVHELVAGPEGATVLDVFTFTKPSSKSYFMDVEAEPRDAERKIYDAAWS